MIHIPNRLSPFTAALVFVSVVRLLFRVLLSPVMALYDDPQEPYNPRFPRFYAYKQRFTRWFLSQLPPWIEYRGGWKFLLKTTRGMDTLDRIVARIPDRVFDHWHRFSVGLMVTSLVAWGIAGIALLGYMAHFAVVKLPAHIQTLMALDVATSQEPTATWEITLDGIIQVIPNLLVSVIGILALLVFFTLMLWLFSSLFLPGLILHEFGHYASLRKAGCPVESYGIMITGPILGGAFVEPSDEITDLPKRDRYRALSTGIANSLLWGLTLLTVGVLLTEPSNVLQTYIDIERSILVSNPVGSLLLLMGGVELLNSLMNSIPAGPIDGGRFIQEAEASWLTSDWSDGLFSPSTEV